MEPRTIIGSVILGALAALAVMALAIMVGIGVAYTITVLTA